MAIFNPLQLTPEFSMVRFDGTGDALPYINASDISFQVKSEDEIIKVRMTSLSGDTIQDVSDIILRLDDTYFVMPQFTEQQDCFRIELLSAYGVIAESNVFVRVTDEKYTSRLRYLCNENSFGFVYQPSFLVNAVRLPAHVKNPQFTQLQNVYHERNGKIRVTSAAIGKEYQLETDYISEQLHKSLIIALSHDAVFIDGELLTKTGDYNIDWENYREINGRREAKATCTMSANVTARNSNCGSEYADADFVVYPTSLNFDAA